jgi:hypothetical protein
MFSFGVVRSRVCGWFIYYRTSFHLCHLSPFLLIFRVRSSLGRHPLRFTGGQVKTSRPPTGVAMAYVPPPPSLEASHETY